MSRHGDHRQEPECLPHRLARHRCPPEWMLLRPRRDFERLLNPHALGSEDAFLEAKEVAEAEA